MSSSRNPATRNTVAPTPFCKVCRDAGKSEKEYTSHFVKDQPGPDGKVVCPTLLNQACRICHKTGHTSSYCSEYNTYRREDRREDRQPIRREERYIERECQPRRQEERRYAYNTLREDTERQEREVRDRDDAYYREQYRRSKPWLQVAMKQPVQEERRRQPYAHPHGPKVRLNLETTALSASKHAVVDTQSKVEKPTIIDIRKVDLKHAANWGDEDNEAPFVCDPEQMFREFAQEHIMNNLTSNREFDFIDQCDDQSKMPFCCE